MSTSVLDKEIDVNSVAYFMIASCPDHESQSDSELANGLAALCESQSLTSSLISDNRTGLVYRSKYCAQCHGMPDTEQISWQSKWRCNNTFKRHIIKETQQLMLDIF